MNRIRSHLTFANVVSVIALFVALGGTALAATMITSNSQVGQNVISGHKPPTGKHANVIAKSINNQDVANDSLTGINIKESTFNTSTGFHASDQNIGLPWNMPQTFAVAAHVSVPAGTYFATGSALVDNQTVDDIAGCRLAQVDNDSVLPDDGPRFGSHAQASISNAGHGAAQATLVSTGFVKFDAPGVIRLTCSANPWTATPPTTALAKVIVAHVNAMSIRQANG